MAKDFEKTQFFNIDDFEEKRAIAAIDAELQGDENPDYITPEHHCRFEISDDFLQTHDFVCRCGNRQNIENIGDMDIYACRAIGEVRNLMCNLINFQGISREKPIIQEFYRWADFLMVYTTAKYNAPRASKKTFDNPQLTVIEEVAKPEKVNGLNRYKCKGSRNKYWRYTYKHDGRTKHLHIKGGNERAPLVKKRISTLQKMIDDGADHWAIAKLIKAW